MSVIDIALAEVGISESPPNSNKVKYNTWYYGREVSGASYPWCMTFTQYCFNKAGTPLPYKTASCSALLNWYKKNKPECIVKEPMAGDIAIMALNGTKISHVGLVYDKTATLVLTVEGNTSRANDTNGGSVMKRTRNRSVVKGYIRPFGGEILNMTEANLKKLVADSVKAAVAEAVPAETVYKTLADVPSYWRDEAARLLNLGVIDGGDDSNPEALNIDAKTLRAVIIAMRYADMSK